MLTRWKNSLRENKKVVAFLTSQAISLFGSSLVQYAIMWHITLSTRSGLVLGIYTVCSFLPQILVSLFGGVFADRYNRKLLIIFADGAIALSTLALIGMLVAGFEGLVPIYIVAALRSLGSGIQTPAVNAVIPQIVPEDKLMRVNSINGTIQSAVMLVAPAVAGAILSLGTLPNILMIDIITAAIGIGILLFIRIPTHEKAAEASKRAVLGDMKSGVRFATSSYFLRRLGMYYIIAYILIIPASMFNVLFVTRNYGGDYFYLTWNEVVFFAGSILGGIALAAWGGFKNRLLTLAMGCGIFGFACMLFGVVPPFMLFLAVMFVAGLTMPTFQTPIMVLIQEKTPGEMQGRIFSLLQILGVTVAMVATMVFGPLFDVFPMEWAMLGCGALLVLFAGLLCLDKRFIREGLPKKGAATAPKNKAAEQET